MKGNKKLLKTLDALLADELTAISQYMVHAEMCEDWGYKRLAKKVEARAIQEMKHAEKLIARILFLEGTPTVDKLNPMHIGADVPKQLASDHKAEEMAIKAYNEALKVAAESADAVTRQLLESILHDEDDHIDWIETQLEQIKQMGLETYLSIQIEE